MEHSCYIYYNEFAEIIYTFANMKKLIVLLFLCCTIYVHAQKSWIATWATAPQFTTESNMPKTKLNDCSVRQTVHISTGGDIMRLKISNEYGNGPLKIKSIYIADAADSCNINDKNARYLLFKKKHDVTIDAGKATTSDAIKFHLKPLQRLAITINYEESPSEITSHPGSRTTSYIIKGIATPKTSFSAGEKIDHWFNISAIDVMAEKTRCIAILGNSITDGRGSTTNMQNRWTDAMAEAMPGVAVLNLGIGGNCVLHGGLADPAVKRFDRDILFQNGVTDLIIFEGINDIGGSNGNSEAIASELITAYKNFASLAHAKGLKVYIATITPFGKHYYYTPFHEAAREVVNEWIRKQKDFDGVIDFDSLVRDNAIPTQMNESLQQDWLHLNADGYKLMGKFAAEKVRY